MTHRSLLIQSDWLKLYAIKIQIKIRPKVTVFLRKRILKFEPDTLKKLD